ncbi:MAG: universal stress protein [Bacteroidia bacterium]|jgi:nucleotide-binding universal stress UspA family protein|nr:universal stress protein [Bacteroidia bacterium]
MTSLKVLIPTDFSVQAEYAYLMVKKLEEKIPVEIHFLHVLSVPDTVGMDKNGNIQTCGEISVDFVVSQKDIALRKLNNLKKIYGNDINVHLELGKLTEKIVSFSKTNGFDLIVMGTKGAWGLKEKLSGSETQMIARQSQVPLLSLMCDRSDLIIENILLVHDFRTVRKENLSLLHKLIVAFNTKTHFLQIIFSESERAAIEMSMDKFARENSIINYDKHFLIDKDIENGVVHFNQMHEMDVVCMGTHGKGGLFHTSATEKLVNHLFKPIISFHIN